MSGNLTADNHRSYCILDSLQVDKRIILGYLVNPKVKKTSILFKKPPCFYGIILENLKKNCDFCVTVSLDKVQIIYMLMYFLDPKNIPTLERCCAVNLNCTVCTD